MLIKNIKGFTKGLYLMINFFVGYIRNKKIVGIILKFHDKINIWSYDVPELRKFLEINQIINQNKLFYSNNFWVMSRKSIAAPFADIFR